MHIRFALSLCLLALLSGLAHADPLRVGVAGAAPFVTVDKLGKPAGFAVDVWQAVAGQEALSYELIPVATRDEAVDQLVAGTLDVVIGDLALTSERISRVDFTVPFYHSSLGILSRTQPMGVWERIRRAATLEGLAVLALLSLLLLGVGSLIWFFERRGQGDFPTHFKAGIGEGVWLALVTLTTVGFGDRVPRTTAGRLVVGACMLLATVSLSSLTAAIASGLTLAHMASPDLNSMHDLSGHRVAVVEGTPSVDFVLLTGARPIRVKNVDDAVSMLMKGGCDAAVDGYPVLGYSLTQNPQLPLQLYRSPGLLQDYGFACAHGNPLVARLNVTLLRLREQGRLRQVEQTWLSQSRPHD